MLFALASILAAANPINAASAPTGASIEEGAFQLDMVTADMLRTTCEGGDATACHRLGRRYEQGIGGVGVSFPDAATWFKKGCDAGVVVDCGLAANVVAIQNDAGAWPLAKKGCDAADPFACFVLGHLQVVGLGVTADPPAGLERIRKACDAGIPNACAELGMLYAGAAAPSIPADYAKAHPLLTTACTDGDMNGCGWLGSLVLQGNGVPADAKRGFELLDKACTGGSGVGCEAASAAWINGVGVTADLGKSVPYLRKACDANMPMSCAHLATMTIQGKGGLSIDRPKALGYLRKACTLKLEPACQELDNACKSGAKDACR